MDGFCRYLPPINIAREEIGTRRVLDRLRFASVASHYVTSRFFFPLLAPSPARKYQKTKD